MANPEHLKILRQGIPTWNAWRESQDGKAIIPDLRTANLKGIDLTKANLREVNFQKALLDNAKFFKANLTEANLRESSLQYADFRYANLTKTDFYRADIYKANFASVHFDEANFAKAGGIETVGLNLAVSDGYTLETINTRTEGSYFVSTRDGRNQANLIFEDGIDWLAFITVYREINKDIAGKNKLEIIEIKDYPNFLVVKVELPPYIDQEKIENAFKRKYEIRERERHEQYKHELHVKDATIDGFRRESINLTKLVENIAKNQSINITNYNQSGNFGIGHMSGGTNQGNAQGNTEKKNDFQSLFVFLVIFCTFVLLIGVFL